VIDAAPVETPGDLRAALVRLDLRLRRLIDQFRADLAERARDPLRGLYISEADVESLLAELGLTDAGELPVEPLLAHPSVPGESRIAKLAEHFGLTAAEQDVLMICLAPDLDLRYERLFGYLQDDVTRRRPTVELVLRLLASTLEERAALRVALGPNGRLAMAGLLAPNQDDQAEQGALLARPLRLEERVVDYLLGSDTMDPRVAPFGEVALPSAARLERTVGEAVVGLARMLSGADQQRSGPVLYLEGPPGSGKRACARTACSAAGRPLLLIDLPDLLAACTERTLTSTLVAVAREALLQDAVLCLDRFDVALREQGDLALQRPALLRCLGAQRGPSLLLGETRWEPTVWMAGLPAARVQLPVLSAADRVDLWRIHLNGHVSSTEVGELAARYRLAEDESIQAVASAAASRSALRGSDEVDPEDVRAAARAIAAPPLEGLAQQIEPRYGWADIVLSADASAQLHELCARVRHQALVLGTWGYGEKHARRAGLTALFVGPPGTGKTMAAEIIAGELGLELYRIDLSAVVSKYIGETEKNIERIFRAADQGDAVLLFDEADALFGKRSEVRDAHDRYANVETAYLLQRLETYQGLAVLTTNLRANIDEAFLRRLDCVLEFPIPEQAERLSIWRRALPQPAPVDPEADLEFLARKFKLAGGHIRNIALTAAFLAAEDGAPIGMGHLARATRREYQKLGKLVAESDFEHYYPLLREGKA
jgi:SpoVK/Ycf46/Vps4 family AAA+-type ATPase